MVLRQASRTTFQEDVQINFAVTLSGETVSHWPEFYGITLLIG